MAQVKIKIQGKDRVRVLQDIVSKLTRRDFDIVSIDFNVNGDNFGGILIAENHRNIMHQNIIKFLRAINSITQVEIE